MNAGISAAGQEFAAKNCDCLLTRLVDMEQGRDAVATLRALARTHEREIDVYGSAHVVLRATQREADEYYHWYAEEMADVATLDIMSPLRGVDREKMSPAVYAEKRRRMAGGCNSYPLVGDADAIANEMARISAAGFTGLAISFVNYLNELPDFVAEVIPRLEGLGLRYPVASAVVA